MEEINEFLRKNNQSISLILINFIIGLILILILHATKIIDINIFFHFKYIIFSLLIISFILLSLKYSQSKNKQLYKKIFKIGLSTTLLLKIAASMEILFSLELVSAITIDFSVFNEYINFLFVFFSLLTLFCYKEELQKKENFKMGNRITYFILFLILIGFTLIKLPYFGYDFTGDHAMKYNTYVEPAKYMAEKGDFLWYQQKYLADPINNPEGIMEKLPQFPILEWSLASVFSVFPNVPIEISTRIVTHIIGSMTLIFAFLLIRKWTNNMYALITTALLAVNSVIAFASFVTVYDGINFMLLMISLYLLSLFYEKDKSIKLLILSGIITGIGLSIKISFLIWILPISILIIFFKNKKLSEKILDFGTFYLFSGTVYLTTRFSIPTLRTDFLKSLLILISGTILIILLCFLTKKFKREAEKIIESLHQKKLLIPIIGIFLLITIPLAFKFVANDNLVDNFLTDKRFLFNFQFYKYMLEDQFMLYLTEPIYLVSIVGLIVILFKKSDKKIRFLNIAFLITSLFFWIVASKSIFPHSYYTEIIMFSFILPASYLLYCFITIAKKDILMIFSVIIFSFFLLLSCSQSTRSLLSRQFENFKEASEYLEENTEDGDLYIDESYLLTLTLETGVARIGNIDSLSNEDFKQDVVDLGFKEAMDKYSIRYLITFNDLPNYEDYIQIFTDDDYELPKAERAQVILNMVDPVKYPLYIDSDIRNKLIKQYDLESKFVFEKQIGLYRFFRFSN